MFFPSFFFGVDLPRTCNGGGLMSRNPWLSKNESGGGAMRRPDNIFYCPMSMRAAGIGHRASTSAHCAMCLSLSTEFEFVCRYTIMFSIGKTHVTCLEIAAQSLDL